jgi:small-conductance mechanosensitive channel
MHNSGDHSGHPTGGIAGGIRHLPLFYWIKRSGNETLETSLNAPIPAVRVVIWAVGAVFLLDNLGFDISAVVAGLGIGGIAIALAAQGILGDLFSYFSILLDQPFEIGDFVVIGDLVGTVEHMVMGRVSKGA